MIDLPTRFEKLIPEGPVNTVLSTRHSDFDLQMPPLEGRLYQMRLTHSSNVAVIQKNSPQVLQDTDALIATTPGHILGVTFADCLPVLVYHPEGAIAIIHAGRRGSLSGITQKTLQTLKSIFGNLDRLSVYFGPSISVNHYPISTQLHYNLVAANRQQVLMVAPHATLHVSPYDTYSDNHLFYSYRKGDLKPRNCCFIQLQ